MLMFMKCSINPHRYDLKINMLFSFIFGKHSLALSL